jgi:voltage-gated potassium channel
MKLSVLDVLVVVATVVACLVLPYEFAMASEPSGDLFGFGVFLSLLYAVDFMSRFLRGQGGLWVRLLDVFRYRRMGGLLDLVAAFPFFLVASHAAYESLILVPLIKIFRVLGILIAWQAQKTFNPTASRMRVFALLLVLVTHEITCGWIAMGAVDVQAGQSVYITALYWCVTTLTTVGYGDIIPGTDTERLFTMVVMILGAGSYGFLIGNLASFLSSIDVARAGFLDRMGDVDSFLRYKSVPRDLRKRVRDYYNYIWDSRMAHDEATILGDLMPSLRLDLMLAMHRNLIEKVPFFRNADASFIREVIPCLSPEVMLPSDIVFSYGQPGDCMYFIGHGRVEVLAANGVDVLAVLDEGSYFGELALLENTTRSATVRAADYCILYRLKRHALQDLLKSHPDFAIHVFETMESYRKKEPS